MKKSLKIILSIIVSIISLFIIDFIFIFVFNRPLFGFKVDNGDSTNLVYKGIFYDTYNCLEYSKPQVKIKGTKFSCGENDFKVKEIVDTTKEIKDFACAEVLEQFYEDETNEYYYSCMKSKYIVVRYENGFEETVSEALKKGSIKISDLDHFNINYHVMEKY